MFSNWGTQIALFIGFFLLHIINVNSLSSLSLYFFYIQSTTKNMHHKWLLIKFLLRSPLIVVLECCANFRQNAKYLQQSNSFLLHFNDKSFTRIHTTQNLFSANTYDEAQQKKCQLRIVVPSCPSVCCVCRRVKKTGKIKEHFPQTHTTGNGVH